MSHWVYTDNKTGTVVFQCDGSLQLTEADKLYTHLTGNDPSKQFHIGVHHTEWSVYKRST